MTPKNSTSILIFADGASSGNPGPGGWGAIVVIPGEEVRELGGADPRTTNNRMELQGVIQALQSLENPHSHPIEIHTDSKYVIQGITRWVFGWQKNQWKTAEGKDVLNQDLWQRLIGVTQRSGKIQWKHVAGHQGIPGNERCDEIAVAFSQGRSPSLYRGSIEEYSVDVFDLVPKPAANTTSSSADKSRKKKTAHSYLSLINRQPMRHATWAECEQRIRGASNAKFKKSISAEDEAEILKSWGFDPQDL